MTVQEFTNEDNAAVSSASKILCSRYRDFVEYEDVQQELYIWLFKKYATVQGWREELSEKHAERTLIKSLRNAGERYCREQKAQMSGYEPDDEFFYTIPMVSDMLQLYFDPEWTAPPALEMTQTSGGKPPQEGWNLQAMVADVGKAYEAMPAKDQDLLHRIYGGESTVRDAIAFEALEWDVTIGAADRRIRRVVGRIRSQLGGPRPYKETD